MAKKEKKDVMEMIESPEALQHEVSKVTGFFEENKSTTLGAGIVLIALVAGFFGFQWYKNSQDVEGEKK